MPVRRGVPSLVLSLLVLLALAVGAPSASAISLDTVKGGKTALNIPFKNLEKTGPKGIFVSPMPPAWLEFNSYQEGPIVNFPISGGAVESATMLGTVNHSGGLLIQKFKLPDWTLEKQLEVTDLKIVAGSQLIGNALGLVPSPTGDLINASHSKNPTTGVIHYEADVRMSFLTATVLNTYFSTDAFEGGWILGHLKSDIQTSTLLGL